MSYQEKRSIVNLLTTVLLAIGYVVYVFYMHPQELLQAEVEVSKWAWLIVWIVPLQIGLTIITHILFAIINSILRREQDPGLTDERDKLIDLKSVRNTYNTFLLGFFLAIVVLLFDQPLYQMFNLFVWALFAAFSVWSISQFYFYRRGY